MQIPNFSGATHRSSQVWQYYTELDESTNRGCVDGRSFWPRGRMLGGTGSINSALHIRGSPGDYEPWNIDDGWDWPTIKEYFKKSEKMVDPFILNNPELRKNHGTEGELIVDKLNFTHTGIPELLTRGYKEIGLKYLDDLNGDTQMGVGKLQGNNYKGKRVSTATAFLNPVRERKNLFVLKDTFANKVVFEGKEAKGVEVTFSDDSIATFYASKEVIASAGAVNTPVLLLLSGIGPKSHLQELGIEVLADLPVGENLQDHVRIAIPVTVDTGAERRDDKFWLQAAAQYLIEQNGPHATNYDQPTVNAFLSVPAEKAFQMYKLIIIISFQTHRTYSQLVTTSCRTKKKSVSNSLLSIQRRRCSSSLWLSAGHIQPAKFCYEAQTPRSSLKFIPNTSVTIGI